MPVVPLSSVQATYGIWGMMSTFWLCWRAQASRRCQLLFVLNSHSCRLSEIAIISIFGNEILDVSCQVHLYYKIWATLYVRQKNYTQWKNSLAQHSQQSDIWSGLGQIWSAHVFQAPNLVL